MSNLTDLAQKQKSKLLADIKFQRKRISDEELKDSQKPITYICNRAKIALEGAKGKYEKADEKHRQFIKEAEDKHRQFIKESEEKHAMYIKVLEDIIEDKEKIIWDETHKVNPIILIANKQIENLQKEILDIDSSYTPIPFTHVVRKEEKCLINDMVPKRMTEEEQDAKEAFRVFMMDGKEEQERAALRAAAIAEDKLLDDTVYTKPAPRVITTALIEEDASGIPINFKPPPKFLGEKKKVKTVILSKSQWGGGSF